MLEIFLILNYKIAILRVGKMLAGCLIFGNFDPRMVIKLMLIKTRLIASHRIRVFIIIINTVGPRAKKVLSKWALGVMHIVGSVFYIQNWKWVRNFSENPSEQKFGDSKFSKVDFSSKKLILFADFW